jgi:hypothetical protein
MQNTLGTLRYTLRQFRRSPVFTSAAILTLALGIGGTTAIFTLIHAVMLRSLPVSDPALLYLVGDGDNCCVQGGPQERWGMYSFPLYERLKAATPEFEEVAAFQASSARLSVRREGAAAAAKPLASEFVTGNYFSTLGVKAFGGRLFTPQDDRPSSPPAAVLSHQSWQTDYGADPAVVGSTFVVEGHPFTIVGVAPPGFFGENIARQPARYLDTGPARAADGRREFAARSVRGCVAARYRTIAPGRIHRRHGAAADRNSAAVDAARFRLSRQLDAGHHASASETIHQPGSRGRRCRGDEGRVRPQPPDPAGRVRHGAADCLRQRGESAAG